MSPKAHSLSLKQGYHGTKCIDMVPNMNWIHTGH